MLDSEDRENEGDLVLAASTATEEWMAWTIRHSSGYLCAPMPDEVADRLELPLMVPDSRDPLSHGVHGLGRRRIRRHDRDQRGGPDPHRPRARRPGLRPGDLIRPGHVLPLGPGKAGCSPRPGHTEAAVDLARLAGLPPVGSSVSSSTTTGA